MNWKPVENKFVVSLSDDFITMELSKNDTGSVALKLNGKEVRSDFTSFDEGKVFAEKYLTAKTKSFIENMKRLGLLQKD